MTNVIIGRIFAADPSPGRARETSRRPGLFPRPGEVMDAIGIFRQFELPRLVGFRTEIVFREKMQLPVVHLIRVVEPNPPTTENFRDDQRIGSIVQAAVPADERLAFPFSRKEGWLM